MKEPGLVDRHRDKNGEIARKHGNTRVGTLREHYGAEFAAGFKDTDTLAHVLAALDEPSLTKLVKDQESGKLATAKDLVDKPGRPQWGKVFLYSLTIAIVLLLVAWAFNFWKS